MQNHSHRHIHTIDCIHKCKVTHINYYKTHRCAHTWLQPQTHQKTIWIEKCLYGKIICIEKLPVLGKNVYNKTLLVLKTHLVHKTTLGKVESWCTILFFYSKKIIVKAMQIKIVI